MKQYALVNLDTGKQVTFAGDLSALEMNRLVQKHSHLEVRPYDPEAYIVDVYEPVLDIKESDEESYGVLAGECIGTPGAMTLDDMDPAVVEGARRHAERAGKPFPPPPSDPYSITVHSIR